MSSYTKTKMVALSLITCLALTSSVEAGRIGPVVDQTDPAQSSGFGGWNLENVSVKITDLDYNEIVGKTFETTDGSYTAMVEGNSFESDIHDSLDDSGSVLVNLHGKDWPVGEPAGIKIMNHTDPSATITHSKPASCIMTTSFIDLDPDDLTTGHLDTANPVETKCNSPFQSHKRFKLNMLPIMVDGVANGDYAKGVNLTFNVEAETGTRRYSVLQKINNYTGKRLDGFKVEVGFVGLDGNFTKASDAGADLRLSIGIGENSDADIWAPEELATFSHGLWGPADGDHFLTDGFFDNEPSGYYVDRNDTNDTIYSTTTLPGNYGAIDVPLGSVSTQFGQWLPSVWEPSAIFHDDDNDPSTDAQLMAFYGDIGDGNFSWMKGNDDGFAKATTAELFEWAKSPVYEVGGIEDVLNLGLNYIVEVGDISTFPTSTFTIRITPHVSADQLAPSYVGETIPLLSDLLDSNGTVEISPAPTFTIGESLEIVVADFDLKGTGDFDVNVSVGEEWAMVNVTEYLNRSIFTATLATFAGTTTVITDSNITLQEGSVVTVTYADADTTGIGGPTGEAVATTTANTTPVAPPATSSSSSGGIFSTMDNVSLFAMIFGFLVIGGVIARKKLAA